MRLSLILRTWPSLNRLRVTPLWWHCGDACTAEHFFVSKLLLPPYFENTTETLVVTGVTLFFCSFDRVHVSVPHITSCRHKHFKQPTLCGWLAWGYLKLLQIVVRKCLKFFRCGSWSQRSTRNYWVKVDKAFATFDVNVINFYCWWNIFFLAKKFCFLQSDG